MQTGNFYDVLCWIENNPDYTPDYGMDPKDGEYKLLNPHEKELVYPLIDHIHSDRENGQEDQHYHVDDRFPMQYTAKATPKLRIYPDLEEGRLEIRRLCMRSEKVLSATPPLMIRKSKLKHKCIHKGKCPHRGFDLTGVKPRNGKITCPLHGLEFDVETGKLLNEPRVEYLREKIQGLRARVEMGPVSRDDDTYTRSIKALAEAIAEAEKIKL